MKDEAYVIKSDITITITKKDLIFESFQLVCESDRGFCRIYLI